MRPEDIEGADKRAKREPPKTRRRSVAEIKADLDAIEAEFERLNGKPLLPERKAKVRRPA